MNISVGGRRVVCVTHNNTVTLSNGRITILRINFCLFLQNEIPHGRQKALAGAHSSYTPRNRSRKLEINVWARVSRTISIKRYISNGQHARTSGLASTSLSLFNLQLSTSRLPSVCDEFILSPLPGEERWMG